MPGEGVSPSGSGDRVERWVDQQVGTSHLEDEERESQSDAASDSLAEAHDADPLLLPMRVGGDEITAVLFVSYEHEARWPQRKIVWH